MMSTYYMVVLAPQALYEPKQLISPDCGIWRSLLSPPSVHVFQCLKFFPASLSIMMYVAQRQLLEIRVRDPIQGIKVQRDPRLSNLALRRGLPRYLIPFSMSVESRVGVSIQLIATFRAVPIARKRLTIIRIYILFSRRNTCLYLCYSHFFLIPTQLLFKESFVLPTPGPQNDIKNRDGEGIKDFRRSLGSSFAFASGATLVGQQEVARIPLSSFRRV